MLHSPNNPTKKLTWLAPKHYTLNKYATLGGSLTSVAETTVASPPCMTFSG